MEPVDEEHQGNMELVEDMAAGAEGETHKKKHKKQKKKKKREESMERDDKPGNYTNNLNITEAKPEPREKVISPSEKLGFPRGLAPAGIVDDDSGTDNVSPTRSRAPLSLRQFMAPSSPRLQSSPGKEPWSPGGWGRDVRQDFDSSDSDDAKQRIRELKKKKKKKKKRVMFSRTESD